MLRAWRDRLVGDRGFRRFAARFVLTRPVARWQARSLFDLCAGFIYAQVLFACVQLDLFELLAAGPLSLEAIARAASLPPEGARALVEAAIGLGLFERRGRLVGLGLRGAAVRGNGGIAAMIRHHAMLYDDLRDPVALLRRPRGGTRLAEYWAYAGAGADGALSDAAVAPYTGLMAESQPMIADEVLAAYGFGRHRCLLDVGGGDGSFLREIGLRTPGLGLMLFDLAPVAAAAAVQLERAGLGARCRCLGGDFRSDALPAGADVISFVRILHDHDDDVVQGVLAKARGVLPAGGTVLIAEPMADSPRAAAYFSLYLHAMGTGRPRSSAELMAMLTAAGFDSPRLLRTPTPLIAQVITAGCKS